MLQKPQPMGPQSAHGMWEYSSRAVPWRNQNCVILDSSSSHCYVLHDTRSACLQNRLFLTRKKRFCYLVFATTVWFISLHFIQQHLIAWPWKDEDSLRNSNLYPVDPLAEPIGFNQNVGIVLQHKTLQVSCFVIDFAILISRMCCEHLILLILHYLILFFECELGGGGIILSMCASWFFFDAWRILLATVTISTNTTFLECEFVRYTLLFWLGFTTTMPIVYFNQFQVASVGTYNFCQVLPSISYPHRKYRL